MRAFLLWPLLLSLAFAAWGCAEKGQYAKEIRRKDTERRDRMGAAAAYEQAKQRFLAGDLAEARRQIDLSLESDPESVESLALKTQIVLEASDSEAQMREVTDAGLKVAPNDARFPYYMGLFHERHGAPAAALGDYLRAAGMDDDKVQYKIAAGEMMLETGDNARAEAYLQDARRKHPQTPGIPQTLGHLAQIRHDYPAARKYFSEALVLAPDSAQLQEDLAVAEFRLGDYGSASNALEKLTARKENAARDDLRIMLAQCYLNTNRPVPARAILKKLLANPVNDKYELWSLQMETALLLRDRGSLRDAANRMIAMRPQAEDGYMALARYWDMSGSPREAIAALDRCPARPPSELLRSYRAKLAR